jgi:sortase A
MIVGGVLTLGWALLVWQWQDPFTAAYTHWQQRQLSQTLSREFADFHPVKIDHTDLAAERREVRSAATRFRKSADEGQAIGRIKIERVGLNMVLVNGTTHDSLTKGPGRDPRTYMPGQGKLVYIAGHRTTYSAPFSRIDAIKPGDVIRIEMPYATFVYRATKHDVVVATDLSVLRSPNHELLALQACHPRFFASHRYIVYGKLTSVEPRGGTPYDLSVTASGG